MKERAGEEKKEENRKLDLIIERHSLLIPKVQETMVKTECYWKCYSYGDDLIPIFEFIDDLRNRSIKEVLSGNHEQTEEHIEKQDKVCYFAKIPKLNHLFRWLEIIYKLFNHVYEFLF